MMGLSNGYYGRSPFTVSQWEELEHQALIFKYMLAGLPVPQNLVLPIQKSFNSIPHAFFHHPTCQFSNPVSFLYDELVSTMVTIFSVLNNSNFKIRVFLFLSFSKFYYHKWWCHLCQNNINVFLSTLKASHCYIYPLFRNGLVSLFTLLEGFILFLQLNSLTSELMVNLGIF